MEAMRTYVALLRGINVGGKASVPMAELRSVLSSTGLEDVTTYIQSGNVVFRSPTTGTPELATGIERAIHDAFAVGVAVLLRTPAELVKIARSNPFLQDEADLSKLHVVFMDKSPSREAVASLDQNRSAPDEFKVREREIYLYLPNGFGRSKLTIDYFERRLGVRATARNWSTLNKLIQLSEPGRRR
jgi:uncharacterized protein (DUF1697 family)